MLVCPLAITDCEDVDGISGDDAVMIQQADAGCEKSLIYIIYVIPSILINTQTNRKNGQKSTGYAVLCHDSMIISRLSIIVAEIRK